MALVQWGVHAKRKLKRTIGVMNPKRKTTTRKIPNDEDTKRTKEIAHGKRAGDVALPRATLDEN